MGKDDPYVKEFPDGEKYLGFVNVSAINLLQASDATLDDESSKLRRREWREMQVFFACDDISC